MAVRCRKTGPFGYKTGAFCILRAKLHCILHFRAPILHFILHFGRILQAKGLHFEIDCKGVGGRRERILRGILHFRGPENCILGVNNTHLAGYLCANCILGGQIAA